MFREQFFELSPAEFFYRNRDLAGFTNPARALYTAIKELIENSLDACESIGVLPEIYVRLRAVRETTSGTYIYRLKVEDNGAGVSARNIPNAFGKLLFGSKFTMKQTRGKFGLGGSMAILYGQITTNEDTRIISSKGGPIHDFRLKIDVAKNKPIVISHNEYPNKKGWHGLVIEISLEGDYSRTRQKVMEYLRQTAIANPHASLTFVDPEGRLYRFERVATNPPKIPTEIPPHPHGVDFEMLQRMISSATCNTMTEFLVTYFHRVGRTTAKKFLQYAGIADINPKELKHEELVKLSELMRSYEYFRRPDPSCLSTLSRDDIEAGIKREFNPEFIAVEERKPSCYSGIPFVVKVAIAYGGNIPNKGIQLYRFANRVPLLYDEASDVSWKILHEAIDWKSYKVNPDKDPVAVFIHLFSIKVPYKTVGKECIADRPEIESEILNGVRGACRKLRTYLSKREFIRKERDRMNLYLKYLPLIARFVTDLAGKEEIPDISAIIEKGKR